VDEVYYTAILTDSSIPIFLPIPVWREYTFAFSRKFQRHRWKLLTSNSDHDRQLTFMYIWFEYNRLRKAGPTAYSTIFWTFCIHKLPFSSYSLLSVIHFFQSTAQKHTDICNRRVFTSTPDVISTRTRLKTTWRHTNTYEHISETKLAWLVYRIAKQQ